MPETHLHASRALREGHVSLRDAIALLLLQVQEWRQRRKLRPLCLAILHGAQRRERADGRATAAAAPRVGRASICLIDPSAGATAGDASSGGGSRGIRRKICVAVIHCNGDMPPFSTRSASVFSRSSASNRSASSAVRGSVLGVCRAGEKRGGEGGAGVRDGAAAGCAAWPGLAEAFFGLFSRRCSAAAACARHAAVSADEEGRMGEAMPLRGGELT